MDGDSKDDSSSTSSDSKSVSGKTYPTYNSRRIIT